MHRAQWIAAVGGIAASLPAQVQEPFQEPVSLVAHCRLARPFALSFVLYEREPGREARCGKKVDWFTVILVPSLAGESRRVLRAATTRGRVDLGKLAVGDWQVLVLPADPWLAPTLVWLSVLERGSQPGGGGQDGGRAQRPLASTTPMGDVVVECVRRVKRRFRLVDEDGSPRPDVGVELLFPTRECAASTPAVPAGSFRTIDSGAPLLALQVGRTDARGEVVLRGPPLGSWNVRLDSARGPECVRGVTFDTPEPLTVCVGSKTRMTLVFDPRLSTAFRRAIAAPPSGAQPRDPPQLLSLQLLRGHAGGHDATVMQLDKSSGPERPGTMAFLVDAPAHYRLYLQTACERRLLLDCGLCVGQRLDVDLRTPPIALLGFRLLVDGKPQIRAGVTIKAVEPSPGEQVRAELHTDMEGRIVLPVFLGRWRVRPLADRELWSRILDVDRVDAEFGDLEVGKTRMWLRLLDERGAPVPDRYIVLGTPEEPMSRMPPPTDAEGRTTLVAIRRGHYQVHVSDPDAGNAGRPPYSPIGEIDVKDDREIELRLPKRPQ